jgi:hypothetical protein
MLSAALVMAVAAVAMFGIEAGDKSASDASSLDVALAPAMTSGSGESN